MRSSYPLSNTQWRQTYYLSAIVTLTMLLSGAALIGSPADGNGGKPPEVNQSSSNKMDDSYGITPSHPESLQKGIEAAYKAGAKRIKIPPGTYRVAGSSKNGCLYLKGLKDFEIDARGVTIVATDVKKPISMLDECSNVTLTGGVFARDPIAFSQGKIEAIGTDRKSFDVRIPKGYPTNMDDPIFFGAAPKIAPKIIGLFDGQTRDWVKGANDIHYSKFERLGPDVFRIYCEKALAKDFPIAVGNLAAWRGFCVDCFYFFRCEKLKIIGCTVYGSGGFTIVEVLGEGGNYYYGCTIARGPAPVGADPKETPLFSSACDGYHSVAVRNGPTYENCYVEFNDDDGFAIQGYAAMVTESKDDLLTVGCVSPNHVLRVGDTLRLYDESGASAGDAKILDVKPLPHYVCSQTPPKEMKACYQMVNEGKGSYRQIKLDHAIPARFAWLAVDANDICSGFVIRNCKVYHNRYRGMLIKASDGLIENCIVDGPTVGGIVFDPELRQHNEADFSRNTVVRNNTIRNVGLWNREAAALMISERRGNEPVPLPGGHKDITIEGNTFENNDGINVIIDAAQRVTLRKNHFIEPMMHDKANNWGIPPKSLYWFSECQDITLEDNEIVRPGPFLKIPVQTTATAHNIKQNGVSYEQQN